MESGLVNKAKARLTGTAGLDRLVGMDAASGRKRASNTASCLRLHRVSASNPRLGVRGGWLQDKQRRHGQCRSPFVAVHNGRSLVTVQKHYPLQDCKSSLFWPDGLHALGVPPSLNHIARALPWRCDRYHKKTLFSPKANVCSDKLVRKTKPVFVNVS